LTWEREVTVANVVSAHDITVIMLDNDEAAALSKLLSSLEYCPWGPSHRDPLLDELAEAVVTPVRARHPSTKVSWTLTNPRFEAVEEGNGIVMHPVCSECGKFVFAVDGCKGHA
jgi:hypothetical protein